MRGGEVCEPGGGWACGVVAARQAACTGKRPDSRLVGGEVRAGRRERGYEAAASAHSRGATLKRLGAKGTRGAHPEHVGHGRDAGGVEAQRLVEGRRPLPRRRGGHAMRGERCASREAGRRARGGGGTQETCTGKAPLRAWEPRARAERTANMAYVVVTLEVSKLSGLLKAFASCRVGGRACDAGGRGASREAGGPGVVAAHKRHSRAWPDSRLGGQGHARSAQRT